MRISISCSDTIWRDEMQCRSGHGPVCAAIAIGVAAAGGPGVIYVLKAGRRKADVFAVFCCSGISAAKKSDVVSQSIMPI